MPQNFLSEWVWLRFIPVNWKNCPKCHGEGIYEEKTGNGQVQMMYCDCSERYKKLAKTY